MFETPTVNDHLKQVRYRIEESREGLKKGIAEIQSKFTLASANGGSRMYVSYGEAMKAHFDTTVREVLGELKRSIRVMPKEDPEQLLSYTVQALEMYARELRSIAEDLCHRPQYGSAAQEAARQVLVPVAENFGVRLSQMLRQFKVGLLENAEPEALIVNNNLTVGNNIGGNIQQGTDRSSQSASVAINVGAITAALDKFRQELSDPQVPPEVRSMIEPEVATLSAQLQKPSPNPSILSEVGKSIRSVVEGVVAGALTPGFMTAVATLVAAIGAG